MAVEEQTAGVFLIRFAGGVNWDRIGQVLWITNRIVSALSFKVYRIGSPTGIVTMTVRRVSDDAVLATKLYGSIAAVSTDTNGVWIGVTFDAPVHIDTRAFILMEWSGTLGNGKNCLAFFGASDVKALEWVARYYGGYAGFYMTAYDATYRYTYTEGFVPKIMIF